MKAIRFIALLCTAVPAFGDGSIFAKGSLSRTYANTDGSQYVLSLAGAGGIAFELFSNVRLEARYTHISSLRNEIPIESGSIDSLRDYMTVKGIYSAGLEIDFTGPRSSFQPFISLGGGYIVTDTTFTVVFNDTTTAAGPTERSSGWSVNGGIGFRIRLAKDLAFEVEAYGYSQNVTQPNPVIDLLGNVGVRVFL